MGVYYITRYRQSDDGNNKSDSELYRQRSATSGSLLVCETRYILSRSDVTGPTAAGEGGCQGMLIATF